MNRLVYLVTSALAATIGFFFWKVWKSEKALRGEGALLEEEDEWGDDFIGAPKPIIDAELKREDSEESPPMAEESAEEIDESEETSLLPEMSPDMGIREVDTAEQDFAWHIVDYQIPEMWMDTAGENIKVAVLDSGILHTHPDLETVDCKDFVGEEGDATDTDGHGTHCSGIVAAKGINDPTIIGVAPQAKLYVAKIAESDFDVTNERVLKGLKWAVRHIQADVVVMSFSLRREDTEIQQLMEDAKDRILFVGASSKYPYPATYNHCLGIAEMDINEDPNDDFHRYKGVDFVAPGIDIQSTFTDPLYKSDSGASMATAYVGGVLALLKAYAEQNGLSLQSDDYVDLLNKTAHEVEHGTSSFKVIQPFDALMELKGMVEMVGGGHITDNGDTETRNEEEGTADGEHENGGIDGGGEEPPVDGD